MQVLDFIFNALQGFSLIALAIVFLAIALVCFKN